MSYSVWLEIDTGGPELFRIGDASHTYNCSPMFQEALGKGLYEFEGVSAKEFGDVLDKGVKDMLARPKHYKQWDPSNGWGSYQSALEFLEHLRHLCSRHPKAIVGMN